MIVIAIVPASASSKDKPRVQSIDLLRGLTVAMMILVNDPGDPQCVYEPLRHADWNGYTLADLIFPNFVFLSGASLVFSLESRIRDPHVERSDLVRGLLKRAVNLLAIKLFLAAAPTFRLRRIRIYGVLARTALLGVAGGLVLLATLSIGGLLAISAGLLGGYWLLLRVPFALGGETLNVPLLDPDNNLAAWLDRKVAHLMHGHLHSGALYNVTHDPEGLLSTLPALATVLHGAVAARFVRSPTLSPERKAMTLAVTGLLSLTAGRVWGRSFPVNKNLWTSSYVLVSTGWSLLVLAAIYFVYDVRRVGETRLGALLAKPMQIFGANALPVYVLSLLGHKTARTIQFNLPHEESEHRVSLRTLVYRKMFARHGTSPAKSLAFAISYAALCFVPNLLLWRRKVFLKV